MSNDFSNWSREDFARWLHVNYPAPPGLLTDTSWVFGLRIYIAKEASIDSYSSKVGYEACLDSLAESLASFARDGTLSTEPTERLEITPIPVADRGGGEESLPGKMTKIFCSVLTPPISGSLSAT